ncbi:MAG: TolC family protein [Candidatus Ozemobacteraceae bacterium]
MKRDCCIPEVFLLLFIVVCLSGATFGETPIQSSDENVAALYKTLEKFNFRNDAVLNIDVPELTKIDGKHSDDQFIGELLLKSVSLKTLQIIAFFRNPALESTRQIVRSRAEMYPQTMYVDALAEQYRSFVQGIDTRTNGGGMKTGPELLFPGPGILSFNGRLARLEVEMALEEYAMKLRDVAAELLTMAAEREMLRQSITVMDRTVAVLRAFEESLTSRFSTDKAMYPELARLQSERQRMINERTSMQRMMQASLAGINRLLGRKPDSEIGKVILPQPMWTKENMPSRQRALESRQEIRIQKLAVSLLESLLALKTRSTILPLSPGFAYAKQGMTGTSVQPKSGMSTGKERMNPLNAYKMTFGTEVSTVKVPDYGIRVSYLRELQKRIEAEKFQLTDLENVTGSELSGAQADFENAKSSSANERTRVLPILENALKSADAGYRTGQITFLEWMELFMNTFSSRLAAIRYEFSGYKSIGKIFMLQGSCNF